MPIRFHPGAAVEISAHFADVYGASVSEDVGGLIRRISRPGRGRDAGVVGSPVGEGLRGGVHRRDQ